MIFYHYSRKRRFVVTRYWGNSTRLGGETGLFGLFWVWKRAFLPWNPVVLLQKSGAFSERTGTFSGRSPGFLKITPMNRWKIPFPAEKQPVFILFSPQFMSFSKRHFVGIERSLLSASRKSARTSSCRFHFDGEVVFFFAFCYRFTPRESPIFKSSRIRTRTTQGKRGGIDNMIHLCNTGFFLSLWGEDTSFLRINLLFNVFFFICQNYWGRWRN